MGSVSSMRQVEILTVLLPVEPRAPYDSGLTQPDDSTESHRTQCLTFPDSPELIFYYKAVEFHEITSAPREIKFCSQHALKWLGGLPAFRVATGCATNDVTKCRGFHRSYS
jgi:hypothetical protein